jgi:hypothetical protein
LKKEAKPLRLVPRTDGAEHANSVGALAKVFWFLFSKKNPSLRL